ncbi:MAG: AMP-binding protein, partial [Alphaproteobacteria bacterium]
MRGTATLQEMVEAFRLRGEAPAIIAFRGDAIETWSYARLGATATALARGLAAEGMARAEPVGILAPNSPEWVAVFFAIVSGGGLAVPLDPALPDTDLARALRDSGLGRIFAAAAHVPRLRALDAARGLRIVVLDDGGAGGAGTCGWRGLARESSAALAPVAPDDPASLVYTSGTTASPKG